MRARRSLAGCCLMLLLTCANLPLAVASEPIEPDEGDRSGGNAVDAARPQGLPHHYVARMPLFYRYLASTVEGRVVLYRLWLFRQLYWRPPAPPQDGQIEPAVEPPEEPAESILDQIDERDAPPVLVGEPGTAFVPADSAKPAVNQASPPNLVQGKE